MARPRDGAQFLPAGHSRRASTPDRTHGGDKLLGHVIDRLVELVVIVGNRVYPVMHGLAAPVAVMPTAIMPASTRATTPDADSSLRGHVHTKVGWG
jgi:hypothetical protein